ncbi:MAG: formylglycine-generating enzyme family protein [Henriciella sp.]
MSTPTNRSRPLILGAALLSAFGLGACDTASTQSDSATACEFPTEKLGTFVQLSPGSFVKGTAPVYREENPTQRLSVDSFWIQIHEVTNAQFSKFVEETGYITEVEQGITSGRVGAGSAVFHHPDANAQNTSTWSLEHTTTWRSQMSRPNSPVVHVTKKDAEAYAAWAGGRLPNEVEWEYAAQLGLADPTNQASGAYSDNGPRANTWQGIFPIADTGEDGFRGVADIGCFEPDELGLYDMIGNVWEWTDTPFGAGTHTIKGGSFLCADNFCRRYRPAARQPQESDFSSNHIGFRIVRDTPLTDEM